MPDSAIRPKRSDKKFASSVEPGLEKDNNKADEKGKCGRSRAKKNTGVSAAHAVNGQKSQVERSDLNCSVCKISTEQDNRGLQCHGCGSWFHMVCLFLTDAEYSRIVESNDSWTCIGCAAVKANGSKISWGDMTGLFNISQIVKGCYQEVVKWKKDIFMLPRGNQELISLKNLRV